MVLHARIKNYRHWEGSLVGWHSQTYSDLSFVPPKLASNDSRLSNSWFDDEAMLWVCLSIYLDLFSLWSPKHSLMYSLFTFQPPELVTGNLDRPLHWLSLSFPFHCKMIAFSKFKDQLSSSLGDRLSPKAAIFAAGTGLIVWKLMRSRASSQKKKR